jgi:hypothetical protein
VLLAAVVHRTLYSGGSSGRSKSKSSRNRITARGLLDVSEKDDDEIWGWHRDRSGCLGRVRT